MLCDIPQTAESHNQPFHWSIPPSYKHTEPPTLWAFSLIIQQQEKQKNEMLYKKNKK